MPEKSSEQAKIRIRNEAIMAAKMKRTVDYNTLKLVAGQHDLENSAIDKYLREIAIEDAQEGRPILWAIVQLPGEQFSSEGFFELIRELGLSADIKELSRDQLQSKFTSNAFEYWSRRRKTGKRKY